MHHKLTLPFLQRIPILAMLTALSWSGASNSQVVACSPQSQVQAPAALEHAEKTIEEAEKFDASYLKAAASLNDYALQDLDSKRESLQSALVTVNAELGRYLEANPKDVDALLLQVRFDLAKQTVYWSEIQNHKGGVPGQGRDPEKTLISILQLHPENAEAHYRRAQVSFSSKSDDSEVVALAEARLAVERDPQNVTYREFLATILVSEGFPKQAAEVVKPLQGGRHPMYRLLVDLNQAPVPEGSIFDPQTTGILSLLAPRDYPQLRVRGFLFPGPALKVEAFYRKLWPDLKPQPNTLEGFDPDSLEPANGFVAIFRWKDGRLTFSPETISLPFPKDTLTLLVSESPKLTNDRAGTTWKRLPDNFSGERACTILWIDCRAFNEGSSSPAPQK